MRSFVFAAIIALAASPAYASQTATVETETAATDVKPKTKKVCHRENDVNSRFSRKVCKTVKVEEEASEAQAPHDAHGAAKAEADTGVSDDVSQN